MSQWKLDRNALGINGSVFLSNTAEYPVKSIFYIGNSQVANPACQPGNSIAEIFYYLEANFWIFSDELLKLTTSKTTS